MFDLRTYESVKCKRQYSDEFVNNFYFQLVFLFHKLQTET